MIIRLIFVFAGIIRALLLGSLRSRTGSGGLPFQDAKLLVLRMNCHVIDLTPHMNEHLLKFAIISIKNLARPVQTSASDPSVEAGLPADPFLVRFAYFYS